MQGILIAQHPSELKITHIQANLVSRPQSKRNDPAMWVNVWSPICVNVWSWVVACVDAFPLCVKSLVCVNVCVQCLVVPRALSM